MEWTILTTIFAIASGVSAFVAIYTNLARNKRERTNDILAKNKDLVSLQDKVSNLDDTIKAGFQELRLKMDTQTKSLNDLAHKMIAAETDLSWIKGSLSAKMVIQTNRLDRNQLQKHVD